MRASCVCAQKKRMSEQRVNETLTGKALKHMQIRYFCERISAVSRESNSTAELTLM